jgi:ubiquinone/menaquinone biosynthesis C-methylase UbiE
MDDDAQPPELTRADELSPADASAAAPPAQKRAPRRPAAARTTAKSDGAKSDGAKSDGDRSDGPKPGPPKPARGAARKTTARKPAARKKAPTAAPPSDPTPTNPRGMATIPQSPPEPTPPTPPAEPAAAEPAPVAEPVPVVEPLAAAEPAPAVEPAAAEDVERAWKDNSLAQVLYHDWEAGTYDEKWSISFDDRCITYARDRFSAAVGPEVLRSEAWPYPKVLEIGAGTGFFSLNLKQAGVVGEVHVTDVSAGMVQAAGRNAAGLGFEVVGAVAGAEELPYPDDTFDLVVGHAVIHHIPDVEAALREVLRVLRPGGRFVIAGEPTRAGDWYARRLGRLTWRLTTTITRLPRLRDTWARSDEELDASSRAAALEAVVDLHTFVPDELAATARRAGARQVRTQTEELLAAFLGWPVRTFEAAVKPEALGLGWAMFAYRSWRRLSAIDRLLQRFVPARLFYNVAITGIKGPARQEP